MSMYGKGTTTYYVSKECHKGTIEVFTDPTSGIKLKGGGSWKDLELLPNHLILDCGAGVDKNVEVYGFTPIIDLEKYNPQSITINWPDFGAPLLDFDFWEDLVTVLRDFKKDVIVCCQGGHGRTGTCLSILIYLMNPEIGNPVEFVRKNYCKEAVENSKQIWYIEDMCNISLKGTDGSNIVSTYKTKKKEDKKKDKKEEDPFYWNSSWPPSENNNYVEWWDECGKRE